jgi:hypothetical protein
LSNEHHLLVEVIDRFPNLCIEGHRRVDKLGHFFYVVIMNARYMEKFLQALEWLVSSLGYKPLNIGRIGYGVAKNSNLDVGLSFAIKL